MTAFSWQWLELTLDTAAKSLLLAALAAVTIWMLKVRNSHVRHRLWTGVLTGMLTLPLLSQVVPQLRLPIPVPQQWTASSGGDTLVSARDPHDMLESARSTTTNPGIAGLSSPLLSEDLSHLQSVDSRELRSQEHVLTPDVGTAPDLTTAAVIATARGMITENSALQPTVSDIGARILPSAPVAPSNGWQIVRHGPFWLAAVWFLGTTILLLRLLSGLVGTWRLQRASMLITAEDLHELGVPVVCWPANVRSVLLECSLIRVPLTLGVIRPVVLLPLEWLEWSTEKLEAVLMHERMHVERRDSSIAFLSELNVAMNWLNPLSWWLRQRLSALAEESCDDAAIVSTGDRTAYARHLLEVAASVSTSGSRLLPATVSMARHSNVESRIVAILDFTRPLSKRPTWATTLLILLLSGPVIALAAALAPSRDSGHSNAPEAATTATSVEATSAASKKEVAAAQPASEQKAEATPQKSSEVTPLTLRGRVLDQAGKTVAGAIVLIRRPGIPDGEFSRDAMLEVARLTSGANGEFEHTFVSAEFGKPGGRRGNRNVDTVYVIATKTEHGMAINASWNWKVPQPLDVSLTVIEPICGRLVDAEGRPVAGAVVQVVDVFGSTTAETDKWLSRVGKAPMEFANGDAMSMERAAAAGQRPPGELHISPIADGLLSTKSGADGTFELQGIGRDQRILLQITAEKLATTVIDVIARPIEPVRVATMFGRQGNRVFYGSMFSYVMEAGISVAGRITDSDTGQPIVGAEVRGRHSISGETRRGQLESKSDSDGHFRIEGMAWTGDNRLQVTMPNLPYLGTSSVRVPRTTEVALATVDLKFKRVVWASGRVTNVQTGQPVAGTMFYTPFANNEFVKLHPSYSNGSQKILAAFPSGRTAADGRFRIPVIQGRGIVCFLADEENFALEVGREKIPEFSDPLKTPQVTIDHGVPSLFHAVREVNPAPDATEVAVDLQPDSGRSITLHLVNQQGRPLSGTRAVGTARELQFESVKGSDAILRNAMPGNVRRLYFVNDATGDRADVLFRPDAGQTDATVILLPPGRIIGRLVDPDGRPVQKANIATFYMSGGVNRESLGPRVVTDQDGRFSQEVTAGEKNFITVPRQQQSIVLRGDLVAEPGETIDIGDFEVELNSKRNTAKPLGTEKRNREPWRKSITAAATSDSKPTAVAAKSIDVETFHYAGTVVDEAGQPVEGATVTLTYWQPKQDKPKQGNSVISDAKGQFELTYLRPDFAKSPEDKPWTYSQLVATKRGHGFAMRPIGQFETTGNALKNIPTQTADYWKSQGWLKDGKLALCADLPIRGRIIDTEGRPVVGALLQPFNADEGKDGSLDAWETETKRPGANFYTARDQLRRLFGPDIITGPIDSILPPTKTNADGYFTLEGVGRERMVSVVLSGPNIESSILRLRSRAGRVIKLDDSDRGERVRFHTYYPIESISVAGPTQPVEGVVTDLRTGKPVAGALLYAESTANDNVRGNAGFIRTTTAPDGHFRLEGFPPGTNRFMVLPPAGAGYLPVGSAIKTAVGTEPLVSNVALLPGIRARGIVKEAASGKPIRGYVRYFALTGNPALEDRKNVRLVDVGTHFRTDSEGRFEITVLPGPGLITFNANDHFRYPRGEGANNIKASRTDKGGGVRIIPAEPYLVIAGNYAGLIPIEPAADAPSIDVSLTLTALQSIQGRVLAEDHRLVDQYVLYGAQNASLWYQNKSGSFEVNGYQPGLGRRLMAYAQQTDAIGLLDITNDPPPFAEIKLQPASRIAGRLVDTDGQPIAGARIENDHFALNLPSPTATESVLGGKFDPERAAFVVIGGHPILTDEQGRFELVGIMPGMKYNAQVFAHRKSSSGQDSMVHLGPLFTDLVVEPGKKHDLGDVKVLASRAPKSPQPKSDASPSPTK
ncbi:MAG: blaR1 4 [Planctomycetaceae bacterium]|nr:blaR1 4 [Planctomycetaceae bacterium]